MTEKYNPNHIAIIMDGNRRWAKNNGLSTPLGHKEGMKNALTILKKAIECNIKYITYFVFSTENWRRGNEEVSDLMNLFHYALRNYKSKMMELGARVNFIGEIASLSDKMQSEIESFSKDTAKGNSISVQVAINYGGRQEILSAINRIILDYQQKDIIIDENILNSHLQSKFPDPDLIIRTSGEKRISNFLLWQSAYSELYFSDKLWPEFSSEDFVMAIEDYQKRKRKFGL